MVHFKKITEEVDLHAAVVLVSANSKVNILRFLDVYKHLERKKELFQRCSAMYFVIFSDICLLTSWWLPARSHCISSFPTYRGKGRFVKLSRCFTGMVILIWFFTIAILLCACTCRGMDTKMSKLRKIHKEREYAENNMFRWTCHHLPFSMSHFLNLEMEQITLSEIEPRAQGLISSPRSVSHYSASVIDRIFFPAYYQSHFTWGLKFRVTFKSGASTGLEKPWTFVFLCLFLTKMYQSNISFLDFSHCITTHPEEKLETDICVYRTTVLNWIKASGFLDNIIRK